MLREGIYQVGGIYTKAGAGAERSRAGTEPGWCGAGAGVGAELVFDVGGSTRT